jgi:hypothetical protein
MIAIYEGKAVGGPWNGKMIAHHHKTKELFGDNPEGGDGDNYPKCIGYYEYVDDCEWHWKTNK